MTHRLTSGAARIIILVIWLFASCIISPWAVYYQQDTSYWGSASTPRTPQYICLQKWPSKSLESAYFLVAIFFMCYTIPLVCISVCYAFIGRRVCHREAPGVDETESRGVVYKSKVKVVKMLVIVVVLFALTWLPLYIVNVWLLFGTMPDATSELFSWLVQVRVTQHSI